MTILKKPAPVGRPILDPVRERWSPRAFSGQPVPRDHVLTVIEAGRWSASSNNAQPWRILLATSDDPAGLAAAVACFTPRNQRWVKTAPVVMFMCARKAFEANGNANPHAWYDAGQCAALMSLQATALGLQMHQAAGIERDKVRATYQVPDEFDICAGAVLGFQGDPDSLPEELPAREREARVRKALGEIVFSGRFGSAAKVVG